jgi:acetyl esterase/lipase
VAVRTFVDEQASMMVAWRHVGIVPLTLDQARAALHAPGRATREAPPVEGRFPVIVILGGPFYLSTTAEFLAANGNIVVAPVRFDDIADEVPALDFPSSVENAVRDGEWALNVLATEAAADTARIAALGHGAGGMQALMLAMRNRAVRAVVNVDSANFSLRTNPRQLVFYHPRMLRVPYLNLLTSATRESSDLHADFEAMRFSRRYEAVLGDDALRHHDLSDLGRGVTAVLGLRGAPSDAVLRTYAEVQSMLVSFLRSPETWPEAERYGAAVFSAAVPAPETVDVIRGIGSDTQRLLAEARTRDPEAPLFSQESLQRVVAAARAQPEVAAALARFALEVHPNSLPLHAAAADALLAAGESNAAAEVLQRCLSLDVVANDWRAAAASAACRERTATIHPPR